VEEYGEEELLEINLKKLTELEMENGTFNQLENTQEGVDSLITNLDRNKPEVMNTFDNVKEMILPDKGQMKIEDDTEFLQGYVKMEISEMIITRSTRDNTKGDRLIEGEAQYDVLEKYEEVDEIPNVERLSEYEIYHQEIQIENRLSDNEISPMVLTPDEKDSQLSQDTEEGS
jgi:hypothetical protein